jgi:hypothetical protein
MGKKKGEIRADEIKEDKDNAFVGAHEFGHSAGLPDEYNERSTKASYRQPGFLSYTPGSPYSLDDKALMVNNIALRARYYWHLAEWLHAADGMARTVDLGKYQYRIEPHARNTVKKNYTYTSQAIEDAAKVETGTNRSRYGLVLNVIGPDEFGKGDTPKALVPGHVVDGMLQILLRLRFSFVGITDYMDIVSMLQAIQANINRKFNYRTLEDRGKWFIRGKHWGAPEVAFQKCAFFVHPRFLVKNFPRRDDSFVERYAKDVGVYRKTATGEFDYRFAEDQYIDKVEALEREKHFGVTIKSTGFFEKNYCRWDTPTGRELLVGAGSASSAGECVAESVPEMLGIRKKADDIVPADLKPLIDNYLKDATIEVFT